MIDVYFCHIPNQTPDAAFRNHLARGCLERWRLDPQARVVVVQPTGTPALCSDVETHDAGPAARFHLTRYRVPRARGSEGFVVADDDCLPLGRGFMIFSSPFGAR